ncbi:MAG: DUF5309 family protein [Euryarchaeota archaeon]|nr:DUF5309 family protein [Euryarchaeota archaeon]
MAVVSGARAQTNFSTNREKLDFAEGIALLDPNENPFTLATLKFGRGTSGNIKHSWLEDELQPETDQNGDTALSSSATTITVDNNDRFAAGDLVRHDSTKEVMLVTALDGETGIVVTRDYGQGGTPGYTARADTIAADDYLTIIGNAFEQGHDLPTMKSTIETEKYNFCQDLRTPFGISEIAAAAAVRGEADWPYQMRKNGIEHARQNEYKNFWGVPQVGDKTLYSTSNTAPATAGGAYYYINANSGSDRNISQAELTQTEFRDGLEAMFEYGSRQKMAFCAPIFRSALDYWGISKLNTFSEKTVFGMNVAKWVSSHGTIIFVTHKMLKDPGSDGAFMFVFDMKHIKNITYSNIGSTRLRMLKPYESDGSTIKKAEYQTIGCIEFKNAKCHGLYKGVTSYAA